MYLLIITARDPWSTTAVPQFVVNSLASTVTASNVPGAYAITLGNLYPISTELKPVPAVPTLTIFSIKTSSPTVNGAGE